MYSTGRKIAILRAYYISLFNDVNTESKCLGEILKFYMCDPYGVFNMLLKSNVKQWTTKEYNLLRQRR